ncbi:undecaprenyl/decaprenyl-phosphate alpha-N-acetylglucosaminyl 1-phosphate transferase [Patescibacteria group bacterium]|nr:undecaprenyl/decaprenyl-phosphate alpha-N-acetylglucosaminyl 1-phosphate transferase [Patescibacteria group bacterium]MBU1931129.1 undecaprenyl/decaprenyl-phosphate alpha-N-acetylglucosaminyl 1-phosphate transferase [Patescibacteria group bacterium]
MNITTWLLVFGSALVLSWLTTRLTIWFYRQRGWLDDPQTGKRNNITHQTPVPRGGGLPIFITVSLLSLVFLTPDKHLIGILLGALVLTIVGVLDDIFNLSPYLRLPLLFVAAGIVVAAGIGIPFISNPFQANQIIQLNQPQIPIYLFNKLRTIWLWADLFALVWIVGCMNFINWSKGLDGQLPGIVVIAALTIAVLSLRFSADITQWPVIILALLVAGAYLGFLPWNFYPQKIMPGYGGGILGGFFLAVLSILATAKVGTLTVVLGVPLIDAGWVIFRRLKNKQMPVWGDRGHLHHRLLAAGWGKRRVALFYWIITALLGWLALNLNPNQKFFTIILLTCLIGALIIWLKHLTFWQKLSDRDSG